MSAIVISIDPHLGAEKGLIFFFFSFYYLWERSFLNSMAILVVAGFLFPQGNVFIRFLNSALPTVHFEITELNSDLFTEEVVSNFLSPWQEADGSVYILMIFSSAYSFADLRWEVGDVLCFWLLGNKCSGHYSKIVEWGLTDKWIFKNGRKRV